MTTTAGVVERRALRRAMRARRRELDPQARQDAERAIVRTIRSLGAYHGAASIGAFAAFDGEPSLDALIRSARSSRKLFYMPVLRGAAMEFARLDPAAPMRRNFFGILEPQTLEPIDPRRLDLVLTPLVACDDAGTRLGVGRGYYDRCFGFLRLRRSWLRPKLLGVAYSFQQVEHVARMPWDVPLAGIVTEHGLRLFV